VGISLAPLRGRWGGLGVALVLVLLVVFQQGLWALLVGAVAAAGYYRLLPFYPLLPVMSLWRWFVVRFRRMETHYAPWLVRGLPPWGDEVIWLPLPGHAAVLAAAAQQDTTAALETIERMRSTAMPGLQQTIRRALPQLVVDQCAAVQDVDSLLLTASEHHPILPQLVPTFYDDGASEKERLSYPQEIGIVLPRLHALARDVQLASERESERGFRAVIEDLAELPGQLSNAGLSRRAVRRWQPVLDRWQSVLEAEREYLATRLVREIANPFQMGNPVKQSRDYLFKGRKRFSEEMYRLLLDPSRPTLVLHGPRRCGKSSFLLNLSRMLTSDVLVVYVDMQPRSFTSSDGDLCYNLAYTMGQDLRGQGVAVPPIDEARFDEKPFPALKAWLDAALSQIGHRRVLLCLDEFEKLGQAITDGRVSDGILDELRHFIQHYDPLNFLFCGVQLLEDMGPNWSSYFISVRPIEMLYLEPDEARELLTDPDPEFAMEYAEGVVETIIALTRGHPYLLQLLGSELVVQANRRQRRVATDEMLEEAIEAGFTSGEPYFHNLWTEYTGQTAEEQATGRRFLLALAQGERLPGMTGETGQAALRWLLRYHVIEQTGGGYRFDIPLVARWVRERAIA